MNFYDFYNKVLEAVELEKEANQIRYDWDDFGALIGCECGCGGDSFDWDGQYHAFKEADELDRKSQEIYKELEEYYKENVGGSI